MERHARWKRWPRDTNVSQEALARIKKLTPEDLIERSSSLAAQLAIRTILWDMIICHSVHHRGQLALMCACAGGQTGLLRRRTERKWPLCVRAPQQKLNPSVRKTSPATAQ